MLVLSLDIDFFVDPVAHEQGLGSQERLPETTHTTDPEIDIVSFLESRCQLTTHSRTPGIVIRDHDAAWDILHQLRTKSGEPVELIHVDAHADLGMGDTGYVYLLTEWLSARGERPLSGFHHMNPGNWLAFAAASGSIRSIKFVPRCYSHSQLLKFYMEPLPVENATQLTFRTVTKGELGLEVARVVDSHRFVVLANKDVVQSVQWVMQEKSEFRLPAKPDFVVVCQSPQFTPASADRVLELARNYVCECDLGLDLPGPVISN